jgi:formate dehydrogenase gamma subunit
MDAKIAVLENGMAAEADAAEPSTLRFVRLNASERTQHLIFMTCFVLLALTGFMLKVPEDTVQRLGSLGQTVFFYRSLVHRIAGTALILVSIYHLFYLGFTRSGRRWLWDMVPRIKDAKDVAGNLLYFVHVKKEPPEFDRFSYKQKMEYGALIAGNTLMSITGLMLWWESYFDKFFLDIALIVHGREAVLACLAIIVWHMWEIHFRPHKSPIDDVWITGEIDEEEVKAEHKSWYRKIMSDPELQQIYTRQVEK